MNLDDKQNKLVKYKRGDETTIGIVVGDKIYFNKRRKNGDPKPLHSTYKFKTGRVTGHYYRDKITLINK